MRTFSALSIALGSFAMAAGCLPQVTTGADAGATATTSTPDATLATVTGSGCVQDANTGATLCTATSMCPTLAIDTQAFPDCGFRIEGSAVDIQCVCSGQLCPLGTPTTCADTQSLLSQQTEGTVCAQISDGRCTAPAGTATTSSSSSSGASCDQTCVSNCGGTPACFQACGC